MKGKKSVKRKVSVTRNSVTLPELAKRLKAARDSGAMTQASVAGAAGKNTATYTYWESGTTEPGALALTRACLFIGITPNDVLIENKDAPAFFGADLPDDVRADIFEIVETAVALHKKYPKDNMVKAVKSIVVKSASIPLTR